MGMVMVRMEQVPLDAGETAYIKMENVGEVACILELVVEKLLEVQLANPRDYQMAVSGVRGHQLAHDNHSLAVSLQAHGFPTELLLQQGGWVVPWPPKIYGYWLDLSISSEENQMKQ